MQPIHVTHHAAEQYRARWVPSLTHDEARASLADLLARATLVRGRTHNAERWVADGILLIVKNDPACRARILVTVMPVARSLGRRDAMRQAVIDEVAAIAAAHEEDMAAYARAESRNPSQAVHHCARCGAPATHYSHMRDELVCTACRAAAERRYAEDPRKANRPGKFHSLEWWLANRAPGAKGAA